MSSTKRGGTRSEADFYPTPSWVIDRLVERLRLPGGRWLDLGAGEGAIINAVNAHRNDVRWTAVESRGKCLPYLEAQIPRGEILCPKTIGDVDLPQQFQVAIANPPFSLAMEFIRTAMPIADHMVFLLRMAFLCSEGRQGFMAAMPPDVYVLPNRPSFTGDGKVDSADYAWFHWPPGRRRRNGRIHMLGVTPLNERKKSAPTAHPTPRPTILDGSPIG